MYSYLDRPVASLNTADRLLLDGLRSWALARALGRNALAAVAARSSLFAETAAAETIDDAMALLDDAGTTPLTIQRPCHETVEDDEAVLLAIAVRARNGGVTGAAAALRQIVRADAATAIALLLADASRRLTDATLPVRR